LSQAFKEFNDVLNHKKGGKAEKRNYKDIPQLFTTWCSQKVFGLNFSRSYGM